jgi:hypothetical protein
MLIASEFSNDCTRPGRLSSGSSGQEAGLFGHGGDLYLASGHKHHHHVEPSGFSNSFLFSASPDPPPTNQVDVPNIHLLIAT